MIYSTSMDEIHSFDSYFGQIIQKDGVITIPYVNLGVSEHPLNERAELKYIDIAYMVFEGVVSFEEQYLLGDVDGLSTLYFGGYDVNSVKNREFKITCNNAYLKVLEESKLSTEMWVPINTENYRSNMDKLKVRDFLNY